MEKWIKLDYPKTIMRKDEVFNAVARDMQITIANALQHIGAIRHGVELDTPLKKNIEYEVSIRIRDLGERG